MFYKNCFSQRQIELFYSKWKLHFFRIRPIMKFFQIKKIDIFFNLIIFLSIVVNLLNNGSGNDSLLSKAYLDPSTGSMIISAIVGVFATVILGVKTFWYKIISLFKPSRNNQSKKNNTSK